MEAADGTEREPGSLRTFIRNWISFSFSFSIDAVDAMHGAPTDVIPQEHGG